MPYDKEFNKVVLDIHLLPIDDEVSEAMYHSGEYDNVFISNDVEYESSDLNVSESFGLLPIEDPNWG